MVRRERTIHAFRSLKVAEIDDITEGSCRGAIKERRRLLVEVPVGW